MSDLGPSELDWVLERTGQHRSRKACSSVPARTVIGLAFLATSLRTRVGFAVAAARLGATTVEVAGLRRSDVSMPESVEDTLRTLAGYTDVVVVRTNTPLAVPDGGRASVLNGGDGGPLAEHPSQALIDLYALQRLSIPLAEQTIAVCGDLRMRAARSLLSVLARARPKRLLLMTDPRLRDGWQVPPALSDRTEAGSLDDLQDVDALYVAGIPHGALDEPGRARLRVTAAQLDRMPGHAGVFSPLPVVDEMERTAKTHRAVRMFEQSDDGLFVRMAMLELLLGSGPYK